MRKFEENFLQDLIHEKIFHKLLTLPGNSYKIFDSETQNGFFIIQCVDFVRSVFYK